MSFFTELADIAKGLDLTIRVKEKNGSLTISVLPDSLENVQAITAFGTPEEMEDGLINAIRRPLTETKQLLANSADYINSLQTSLKDKKQDAEKKKPGATVTKAEDKADAVDEAEEETEEEMKAAKAKAATKKPAPAPAAKEEPAGPKQLLIS